MTNANLARNRIGGPLFFALESRFVALLPAGNTGSCTPYFALSGSIRAPVRPISPSRAQYGLLYALFRPLGLNTGSGSGYCPLGNTPTLGGYWRKANTPPLAQPSSAKNASNVAIVVASFELGRAIVPSPLRRYRQITSWHAYF